MNVINAEEISWLRLPSAATFGGVSEQEGFELNPEAFLEEIFDQNETISKPSLIVGYSSVMGRLSGVLNRYRYGRTSVFANCWFQTDKDNECSVDVWRYQE